MARVDRGVVPLVKRRNRYRSDRDGFFVRAGLSLS
jgi:hypothetical protein